MQNGKENSEGFVKSIKEKVHDWEFRHFWTALWLEHTFLYGFLLLWIVLLGFLTFDIFDLYHTDVNSARYMLSALVQSQAAIVAIVITLTLIAVQLTASAYSPRVIRIFRDYPDMWLLLGFYGVSIFYGFIVLKLVEGVEGDFVSQSVIWSFGPFPISLETGVSLAYWLGAFTFFVLFLYMRDIINLLAPASIIAILALDITKGKLKDAEEDPIQSIVDIINGAIMKYDLETTRVGLDVITQQVIKLLDHDDEEKISEWFCEHLNRISRLAISRDDVESTSRVITNLKNFTKSAVEKELENATSEAISTLKKVGIIAAKKELEDATFYAAMSLESAGSAAMEKGLEDATRIAVTSLEKVGVAASEQELSLGSLRAAEGLEEVGKAAVVEGFKDVVLRAALSLEAVGLTAAKKGLEKATRQAAESLEAVGLAAAEKGLKTATWQVAYGLGEVGRAAAKKELDDATLRAALSLAEVGRAAEEKGLGGAIMQAAQSLAELKFVTEEIVKTAIQDYESKLEEQDRDSFQKFMKLYEQLLEKLRAGK